MQPRSIIPVLILLKVFIFNAGLAQIDFGDAPPPYPTLMPTGANHIFAPTIYLGSRIDFEPNGQPNFNATDDDMNGGLDDEDGINFITWLNPGQIATVVVTAFGTGLLDAWIDFQNNGNWTDSGEQIFLNQSINPGINTLTFSVPGGITTGIITFGRFRLSSGGGLLPTGLAPDGEVEDYQILLGTPVGGNMVMDPDPTYSFTQNEISMDVVPISGNIVSTYNDHPYTGGPGIGTSYSPDQGQTWMPQQLPYPSNPFAGVPFTTAFDPTVTANDSGHTFIAHIATDGNPGPASGLFVHKSIDGGVTWIPPVQVDVQGPPAGSPDPNHRFNDRCQITADQHPPSPYHHNIYIAWIQDRGFNMTNPLSDIYTSVSTDGGNTFSGALRINDADSLGNMPVPAVASNGDVYVVWIDYNVQTGGQGFLLLDKSTDGGVNWGTDIRIDTIDLPPLWLNMGGDVLAKGAAVIRTHPTNPMELYITYAADPDLAGPDEGDIFFIRSTNGGISWSPPLRINDDPTPNDQVLPWMDVRPNGQIDIAWYDRRNDPSDLLWDIYISSSMDAGISFTTNAQMNALPFATPSNTGSGFWFGEYMALTNTSTDTYIGFTSSTIDTKGDVMFTSLSCHVTNTNDSGPGSLRYGIGCVNSGDTLYFDASMIMDTITLNSVITINKDVTIIVAAGQQIWVDGSSLTNSLRIMAGATVEFIGLQIFGGNGTNGVVWNQGNLTLDGVTITGIDATGSIFSNEGVLELKSGATIQ
jgi:hypothetical protein